MAQKLIAVCSFTALPDLGKVKSYAQLKALVIEAGRFSIFEATGNQRIARWFAQLSKDPEVVFDNSCGYPWTQVTKSTISEKPPDTISEQPNARATAAHRDAEGKEFPEGTPERVEWLYRKSEHKTRKK